MFNDLIELYTIDWRIFMAGTEAWLNGQSPYGALAGGHTAGAFAYPPTALPWLALFVPFGSLGFYIWTAISLFAWWRLIRYNLRSQLVLLIWSPLLLNLVEGQNTFAIVLVLWAATRAKQRGWLWGLAMAWAMTKPQVAVVPLLWLLWQDRSAKRRWAFLGGIILGTVFLALPATIRDPGIWSDWIVSLSTYRGRILQRAAWQGPSILLLALAAYLWYRHYRRDWQWWITAGLFPHVSFYGIVAMLPALKPKRNNWLLGGLTLAGVLQYAGTEYILPWVLAGHMLAVWMVAGGPQPYHAEADGTTLKSSSPQAVEAP